MQLIQGEIITIMPTNFRDDWGNHYQDVTVRTAQGDISGQKASKNELTQNDIGTQVNWECEVKQDRRSQDYNKFTKPQDPQYGSQGSSQRPQSNAQRPNAPQVRNYEAENRGKVRTQFIKAAIISKQMTCQSHQDVLMLTEFAMSGKEPQIPINEPVGTCPKCRHASDKCVCGDTFR